VLLAALAALFDECCQRRVRLFSVQRDAFLALVVVVVVLILVCGEFGEVSAPCIGQLAAPAVLRVAG